MLGKLALLAVATVLALPARSYAQEPAPPAPGRFFAGLSAAYAQPEGEFRDHVRRGFGGGGNLLYALDGRGTLGLRADLGFITYGRETKRVPLSSTIGGRVNVDVATTNNILTLGVGPQLMLPDGRLRPYVHAILGASYFYTESHITGVRDNEQIARTTNQDDVTFSYGGGAGIYVPLHRGASTLSLDVGARYLVNGQAEYLREGSIRDEFDGTISFTPITSETNFFSFHLGVAFRPAPTRRR